jgi:hypothetical protein
LDHDWAHHRSPGAMELEAVALTGGKDLN